MVRATVSFLCACLAQRPAFFATGCVRAHAIPFLLGSISLASVRHTFDNVLGNPMQAGAVKATNPKDTEYNYCM